jgi:hypothetical protein
MAVFLSIQFSANSLDEVRNAITSDPLSVPFKKYSPEITMCLPENARRELPLRITLPGVSASRTIGCASVPIALSEIT